MKCGWEMPPRFEPVMCGGRRTTERDAGHVLKLLREGRFPRLWVPSAEQRDLRQLPIHRHKLVQIRSRVKNGLQHLAMNQGMQKKSRLWSVAGQKAFRQLPLAGWAHAGVKTCCSCWSTWISRLRRWIELRNKRRSTILRRDCC